MNETKVNSKKYEIVGEEIFEFPNKTKKSLLRIRATKNFATVKTGDLGGLIESEVNLSQKGMCWITEDSVVCENARVYGDAVIMEDSLIDGNARIYGKSMISNSYVIDLANISGVTYISDSHITGSTRIGGHCSVRNAYIAGNSKICGYAEIKPSPENKMITYIVESRVAGNVVIEGSVSIYNSNIEDSAKILSPIMFSGIKLHNCNIRGTASISGVCELRSTTVLDNAEIDCKEKDTLLVSDTTIKDHSSIKGGTIQNSTISGHAAILKDNEILTHKGVLLHTIVDNCEISDNSVVINSETHDIKTIGMVAIVASKLAAHKDHRNDQVVIKGPHMISHCDRVL